MYHTQDAVARSFRAALPADTQFASLRLLEERALTVSVRQDLLQPLAESTDVAP